MSSSIQRSSRALFLGIAALLPLLSACGSSSSDSAKKAPVGPVEELYNNGVDALNARRFFHRGRSVQRGGAELPVLELGRERAVDVGLFGVLAEQIHRGDRHPGPLHPASSGAPRHRLRLLPARPLLLRADCGYPA